MSAEGERETKYACGYCRSIVDIAAMQEHMKACEPAQKARADAGVPGNSSSLTHEKSRLPDGVHLGKFPDGAFMLNCTECGCAMECNDPECTETVHLHPECVEFRIALDKFTKRWWRWWGLKQRVKMFPRRVRFTIILWWYLNIVIQRAGFKHGSTSPSCFFKDRRCVMFKYEFTDQLDLKPLGYYCNVCGWVIEGKWRDMGVGT